MQPAANARTTERNDSEPTLMGTLYLACLIYVSLWFGHEIHVLHKATKR